MVTTLSLKEYNQMTLGDGIKDNAVSMITFYDKRFFCVLLHSRLFGQHKR